MPYTYAVTLASTVVLTLTRVALLSQRTVAATSTLEPRLANGLASTPPMGWNSYNHYACFANESVIRSNAQALVDLGLDKLGYTYVTPDCGWAAEDRLDNGSITWDTNYYPSGFIALGDFIHDLGLSFGVYSDAGIRMCSDGQVNNGSLYNEVMDASTFASWGADMLKYDNCYSEASANYPNVDYSPPASPASRYATMASAIAATGRNILIAICEWGVDFPALWAPQYGNTWRITNDIIPSFSTIFRQVNQFVPNAIYAGPGQWPDLDMLEVGNNVFTTPEEQTHFSLWAILKSPLIIGGVLNDAYASINPNSLAILKNMHLISYNQDSLGKPANLVRRFSDAQYDIWAGPLSGGRTVVAIVNWANSVQTVQFNLPDVKFQMASKVYDVWNDMTTTNVINSYTTKIQPHGTTVLELGGTSVSGYYPASPFASIMTANKIVTAKFSNIYGMTTSPSYPLTIYFTKAATKATPISIVTSGSSYTITATLAKGASSVKVLIPLRMSSINSITITSGISTPLSITIGTPPAPFYDASKFHLAGDSNFNTCPSGFCLPTGTKVGYITRGGTATLNIPYTLTSAVPKYVDVTYCNNDIAFGSAFADGRNARNITLQVSGGAVVRLEAPLSGNVSEIFGYDHGYSNCATLGVNVPNFGAGANGVDTLVVSNNDGGNGVSYFGADMVGLRIYG